MAHRIRTDIESDSKNIEVKKANSVGDEILEYAILTGYHGYVTYFASSLSAKAQI